MKRLFLIGSLLALSACSAEPGSKKWCDAMDEKAKSDWTASDAGTYTMNCLIDGTEVGSEKWCEKLAERPKGEWTGDEAGSYAKHCVI